MTYFLRTLCLYLIIFAAIAVAIDWTVSRYYTNELPADTKRVPAAVTFALPSMTIQPRETETGLLLSGMTAQNRRDWQEAWRNFSKLNEKFNDNPDFALRAFTLALGNGEFKQAEKIATNLQTGFFDQDKDEDGEALILEADKFDLARLFLVFKAVKEGSYEKALEMSQSIQDGPLASFSNPILQSWVNAEINPESITASAEGLNPLQLYNKALAADYGGQTGTARVLMAKLDYGALTPEKIIGVAEFYKRIDESEKAADIVRRNLVKYSDNEELSILLADLKKEENSASPSTKEDSSKSALTPAAAIAEAYHDFSLVMLSEGVVDSTLLFARLASYLNPDNDSFYITIGDVLKYQEQNDQALTAYSRVSIGHNEYERAVAEQVQLLGEADRQSDAKDVVQEALKNQRKNSVEENPYFYFLLGNIHREQKAFGKALDAYNTAETLGKKRNDGEMPRNLWPMYYARAIVYDLTDEWDKAEADLQMALKKFPNSPFILNYLGYAYADRNINLDKAKEMISSAVMAAPNDAYIIDSMGWILYRTGDYEGAVNFLERAAALKPYHMVINAHLGDAYWQVGRTTEAHYMWRRAIDYYDETDEEQQRMIEDTRRKAQEGM